MPKLFTNSHKAGLLLRLAAALLFSLAYAPILTTIGFVEIVESVESEEFEALEAALTRKLREKRTVSALLARVTSDISPQLLRCRMGGCGSLLSEHSKRNGIGSPLRV